MAIVSCVVGRKAVRTSTVTAFLGGRVTKQAIGASATIATQSGKRQTTFLTTTAIVSFANITPTFFTDNWRNNETNHWHYAICEHRNEINDKAAHTYVNGICSEWGYVQGEQYVPTDGYAWNEEGNYIYFGEYPQSEVTNNAEIAALNWAAGTLPTWENAQNWTRYSNDMWNYWSHSAWYIDIVQGGAKYCGLYFTQYRLVFILYLPLPIRITRNNTIMVTTLTTCIGSSTSQSGGMCSIKRTEPHFWCAIV